MAEQFHQQREEYEALLDNAKGGGVSRSPSYPHDFSDDSEVNSAAHSNNVSPRLSEAVKVEIVFS